MKLKVTRKLVVNVTELDCDIGVRWFEDCMVNGKWDNNENPAIPCTYTEGSHRRWKIRINPDTGQILGWPDGVAASVHYKVCDDCMVGVYEDGKFAFEYYGYVPDFLAIDDEGYGDYVILTIDGKGFIKNWKFTQKDYDYLAENS